MRYYEFVHNLGIHSWDIPALIVAVILVVMILVHHRNQKKRLNDFEDDLDQKIQEIREEMAETSRKWQQVKLYRQEKQFRQMELPKYKKEVSR